VYYQQPFPGQVPPSAQYNQYNQYNGEVVAGLSYLFFLVGLIMFFAERNNRFVKFHAAQSLLIHLAALITSLFWVLLFLVVTVTGAAASLGTGSPSRTIAGLVGIAVLVVTLFALALYLVYLGALIWGMIAAFTGKTTKLPLVGELAERWSTTPIAPGQAG
jgi:uncharacterized membrane protein